MTTGLACLGVACAQLLGARPTPGSFGVTSAPAAPTSSPSPSGAGDVGTTPSDTRPTSTAPLGDPTSLVIPVLHLTAAIEQVSSASAALPVPTDAHDVGWWTSSARPGAPGGTVVLVGHVDSARQGPGALFRLTDLGEGGTVTVATTTARVSYRVVGRRVYAKDGGLPADLFDASPTPRLVLITCGGAFDARTRGYRDNVALFAVPV